MKSQVYIGDAVIFSLLFGLRSVLTALYTTWFAVALLTAGTVMMLEAAGDPPQIWEWREFLSETTETFTASTEASAQEGSIEGTWLALLGWLLLLPLMTRFHKVAARQDRMPLIPFFFRLGNAEFRLLGAYILSIFWFGFAALMLLGPAALAFQMTEGRILPGILSIAGIAAYLWFLTRSVLIFAVPVLEGRIALIHAFEQTSGHAWAIFAASLVLQILVTTLTIVGGMALEGFASVPGIDQLSTFLNVPASRLLTAIWQTFTTLLSIGVFIGLAGFIWLSVRTPEGASELIPVNTSDKS